MVRSRSFRFIIWFCVHLALVVAGIITDKDAVNKQTLSSTTEAPNGTETNKSIHIVQNNNSVSDNICLTPECNHSETVNKQTLSSTTEAPNGTETNKSIHIVQNNNSVSDNICLTPECNHSKTVNKQTLSSTTEGSNGTERNNSIHIVQNNNSVSDNICLTPECNHSDTDNGEKLSSTAEALNEPKRNESINIVQKNNSECDNICLTAECVHSASNILKKLDVNVQPCDNFYKFACGGFVSPTPKTEYDKQVNTFSLTKDIVRKNIRTMLEEESSPNEPRPFRLVKDFYKACMNRSAINKKHGVQHLLKILKKLGGWPVLEGEHWNESDFHWTDALYKFPQHGFPEGDFLSLDVSKPANNVTQIYMLGFANYICACFKMSDGDAQVMHRYMVDIAVFLGANRTRATIELKDALEFEVMFMNKTRTVPNQYINISDMTFNELYTTYPMFPTLEYLNDIIRNSRKAGIVHPNDTVRLILTTSIIEFQKLINKTPKRVQANYLLWTVIFESLKYLRKDLQDIINIQSKVLSYFNITKKDENTGWEKCYDLVSETMTIGVNTMYQKKYFTEDTKNTILEILGDVKTEFKKILEKAEWMDEQARAKAVEKAADITLSYAYQDELFHMDNLEKYYEKLETSPDNYLENMLNLSKFKTHLQKHEGDLYYGRVNRTKWEQQWSDIPDELIPFGVNGYYDFEGSIKYNSIMIPAGTMSGIFFNKDRPRYMNYGAIGSLIGHEVGHAFDALRIHLDKENKTVYWKPETTENILNITQCLNDQYIDYAVNGMGINLIRGETELQENTADAGVKAAYYAYKAWVKRNGPEKELPGLSYTPEQIFWISHASRWCNKYDPGFNQTLISYNIGEFRVNGPLWNIDEFSRDFNCPIDSKMNPAKKCIMW